MRCNHEGCTREAVKRPVWSFASLVKPNGPRAEMEFMQPGDSKLPLGVCELHATANDFQPTEESWQRIEEAMRAAGRARPDRRTFRLEYRAISAPIGSGKPH